MTRSLAASTAAMYWFAWAALTSWLPSAKPSTDWAVGTDGSISGGVWNGSQPGAAATGAAGPIARARTTDSAGTRNRRGGLPGVLVGPVGLGPWPGLLADDGPDEAHHDEQPAEHRDEAETAVRRVRPLVGDELEADPEDHRPADKEGGEQEPARRAGHEAAEARRPGGREHRADEDREHQHGQARGQTELDGSREEDREQLHVGASCGSSRRPDRTRGRLPLGGPGG